MVTAKLSAIHPVEDGWNLSYCVATGEHLLYVHVDGEDVQIDAPWEKLEDAAIARAMDVLGETI